MYLTNTIVRLAKTACIIALAAWACAKNPYAAANGAYRKQARSLGRELSKQPLRDSFSTSSLWVGTTNFNMRKPNFVIIHHTAQDSCEQTLRTFTTIATQVSAHYVICRDGTIHHMLNDYLRAWHGGVARWGNTTDINSSSIGIEIDNNGFEPFTDAQIGSLLQLLGHLKKAYNIPAANFIGHSDIAPGRKVDPSAWFPWQVLAENGYGYWYDTTNVRVPFNFSARQALRIIGYNVHDSVAAIHSFKLHFMQGDSTTTIGEAAKKILFDLERKYE